MKPPAPPANAKACEENSTSSANPETSQPAEIPDTNSCVDSSSNIPNPATAQISKPELPNGDQPNTSNTTPQQPKAEDANTSKTELTDDKTIDTTTEPVPATNGQLETKADEVDSQQSNLEGRCKLKELQARGVYRGEHATFWPTGWREKLCTCDSCKVCRL